MFPVFYRQILDELDLDDDIKVLLCQVLGVRMWLPLPRVFELKRQYEYDLHRFRKDRPLGLLALHVNDALTYAAYYNDDECKNVYDSSKFPSSWDYQYRRDSSLKEGGRGVFVPSLILARKIETMIALCKRRCERLESYYGSGTSQETFLSPARFRRSGMEKLRYNENTSYNIRDEERDSSIRLFVAMDGPEHERVAFRARPQ